MSTPTIGIADVKIGRVRDWHDPHNEDCMHNTSPGSDCTCKRKRQRKPFRTVRVSDPHASRAHEIVAVIRFDNGLLTLRQKGRRHRVSINLGVLYERLVLNEAMKAARAHKAEKSANKAASRRARKYSPSKRRAK